MYVPHREHEAAGHGSAVAEKKHAIGLALNQTNHDDVKTWD